MAKTIATIMGFIFLLVGVVGFIAPMPLGFHLMPAHNVVHLLTGAVSLYLGLKGTLSAARIFGLAFGAFYVLLGIAGFALGTAHTHDGHSENLFRLIPGVLEVGFSDNVYHLVVGSVYLIGGLITRAGKD